MVPNTRQLRWATTQIVSPRMGTNRPGGELAFPGDEAAREKGPKLNPWGPGPLPTCETGK